MKKLLLLLIILIPFIGISQCDNGTNYYPSSIYTPTPNSWGSASTCNWAGEVIQVNITLGDTYQFSTCDNYGGVLASYDTQLTLYDEVGNIVTFNDDAFGCSGFTSYINWTATYTGILYVHLNQYNCNSNTVCTQVMIYRTEQATQPGPCTNTSYYTIRNLPTQANPVETIGCYYAGEYCIWENPEQDIIYTVKSTNVNDWVTVRSGTFDGTVVIAGTIPVDIVGTAGETYYIHVNVNDLCAVESSCRDISVTRNIPLPVELISFEGEIKLQSNLLKWATASENNSDYFLLEHSRNGVDWNQLSKIPAMGNSTEYIEYSSWDYNVQNIVNYYRLSQFDFDGQYEVFEIIALDNTKSLIRPIKYVNLLGQEVNPLTAKGMILEVYSNGTTVKTIK